MKYIFLFLLVNFKFFGQTENGNLLLLKVERTNNLQIDKYQSELFVIALDTLNIPLKDSGMMPVLIDDFSDVQLEDCKRGKSFDINDGYTTDTFSAVTNYGGDNREKIIDNLKKMNYLSDIKIKDLLYSKKIKIYYTLISGDYCVGKLTTKNERSYYDDQKIVILSSPITIDNKYKISKIYAYDILKSINFNYFMVD